MGYALQTGMIADIEGKVMVQAHRRHDISDRIWFLLEPHLPGRSGSWGGVAEDNRRFINAIFWILRTGAPWRDLSPDYVDWKNTHRRFAVGAIKAFGKVYWNS